jgi:hypothetical protein
MASGVTSGRQRPPDGIGAAESPRAEASRPSKRRRRHNRKASGPDATPVSGRKSSSRGRERALAEIEQELDRLILKLMTRGGFEAIEHELRKVRRLLYHSARA